MSSGRIEPPSPDLYTPARTVQLFPAWVFSLVCVVPVNHILLMPSLQHKPRAVKALGTLNVDFTILTSQQCAVEE